MAGFINKSSLDFRMHCFFPSFALMKRIVLSILLGGVAFAGFAQKRDSLKIKTQDYNLELNRNPLPTRIFPLVYEPVSGTPMVVGAKINYWTTRSSIGININQASFSNNWKGGGVNSLAVGGLVNHKSEYKKENYSYANELILQYGKIRNRGQLQKKTTDRIYWDHKAAIQLSNNWYFFASINFESQFDNGFAYSKDATGNEVETLISRFMSPGYLTESLGFEYRPNKFFSTRIGTGTARQTFVLDKDLYLTNPKNFGVKHGDNFRNELAFQVVTNVDKDIMENTNLKAKYNMFIPYDNFGHIDHRLDITLTAKVNKYLNVTLTGVGLYDRDTDQKIQANQTLAMGFVVVFPR